DSRGSEAPGGCEPPVRDELRGSPSGERQRGEENDRRRSLERDRPGQIGNGGVSEPSDHGGESGGDPEADPRAIREPGGAGDQSRPAAQRQCRENAERWRRETLEAAPGAMDPVHELHRNEHRRQTYRHAGEAEERADERTFVSGVDGGLLDVVEGESTRVAGG